MSLCAFARTSLSLVCKLAGFGCVFPHSSMGTMAITAISVRFPTINGRVTQARGQVRGQDTKAVVRRRRSGCVTVVVQPISSLVHFVRSAEKVGGIGEKKRTRKTKTKQSKVGPRQCDQSGKQMLSQQVVAWKSRTRRRRCSSTSPTSTQGTRSGRFQDGRRSGSGRK